MILHHNPVDSLILAGQAYPPSEWMNERLRTMGENWQFSQTSPNVIPPAQIAQQIQAPPEKEARIAFSFWQNTIDREHQKTTLESPIFDNEIELTITAINTSDVTAEDVQLFLRSCLSCSWVSVPPQFQVNDPDSPTDRSTFEREMFPNVPIAKWTVKISKPAIPRTSGLAIGGYFACKNCPPVDWHKPQILLVSEPGVPYKLQKSWISSSPDIIRK